MALWIGIVMAAHRFPSEFDWRYMTMSVLLSPRDDPPGRLWAAAGIGLCGLALLIWTFELRHVATPRSGAPTRRRIGIWSLRFGSACMIAAGVLPLRLPGLAKGHELLTLFAFAGLCLGTLCVTLDRVRPVPVDPRDRHVRPRFALSTVLAAILVAPIVIAGAVQAYVFYALPTLYWVGLPWRAQRIPVFLSFAFWEWVTCLVLSVYLVVLGIGDTRLRA